MNFAEFIPENAVSIFLLGQDRPISGKIAIGFDELTRWDLKIFSDGPDFILSDERTAVSLAAVTALNALKYRFHGPTYHGGDPWPF